MKLRYAYGVAAIAVAATISACSQQGHVSTVPPAAVPQTSGSLGVQSFPAMTNTRQPIAGHGAGGAIGPVAGRSLSDLAVSRAAPKARTPERLPAPHPARINVSAYTINPRVIRSEDASFRLRPAMNAARSRTAQVVAGNSFTGNGSQDLTIATDGTYIFSTDDGSYIFNMTGTLLAEIDHVAFFCNTAGLEVCSDGGFPADSRVIYDPSANRWVTSALWLFGSNPVVADVIGISKTSNPLGQWYLYQFPACGPNELNPNGAAGDQPHLGFNRQWLVVATACSPGNPGLAVFDKANLYSGGALALNGNWFLFDDPLLTGNRENPAATYSSRTSTEFLTASAVSGDVASTIYSHIDGPTDAPAFHSATDEVTTAFVTTPDGTPITVSAPGCPGCITAFSNAWTHSSGVWNFAGHDYIVSTAVYNDPSFTNATQAVSIAVSDTGVAKAISIFGGGDGSGPLASEVAMPVSGGVPNRQRAVIGYDFSNANFYPGVMAALWDIPTNTIEANDVLQQGVLTPTPGSFEALRWSDFIDALVPIPKSANLVLAGQLAAPSTHNPNRSIYYATVMINRP